MTNVVSLPTPMGSPDKRRFTLTWDTPAGPQYAVADGWLVTIQNFLVISETSGEGRSIPALMVPHDRVTCIKSEQLPVAE